MYRTATASFTEILSRGSRGDFQSSWWDQHSQWDWHWEQGWLFRAFSSVPHEDPLQDPRAGAEGCSMQLGSSSSKELSLDWSKERAEPWLCCSQRGRQHGWAAVTSKRCVKRPLQCASALSPTSHPFTERSEQSGPCCAPGLGLSHTASCSGRSYGAQQLPVTLPDSTTWVCFLNSGCTCCSDAKASLRFSVLTTVFAEVVHMLVMFLLCLTFCVRILKLVPSLIWSLLCQFKIGKMN